MKHIKLYEELTQDKPQINDYVVCLDRDEDNERMNDFTKKNVGQIVKIEKLTGARYTDKEEGEDDSIPLYVVKYNVPPLHIQRMLSWHDDNRTVLHDRRGFYPEEILYHSKNKEDVIAFIEASKYNL